MAPFLKVNSIYKAQPEGDLLLNIYSTQQQLRQPQIRRQRSGLDLKVERVGVNVKTRTKTQQKEGKGEGICAKGRKTRLYF